MQVCSRENGCYIATISDFYREKRENEFVDFERGKRDRYFVMSKNDNVLAILEFLLFK